MDTNIYSQVSFHMHEDQLLPIVSVASMNGQFWLSIRTNISALDGMNVHGSREQVTTFLWKLVIEITKALQLQEEESVELEPAVGQG